jgi:hypothetical protein
MNTKAVSNKAVAAALLTCGGAVSLFACAVSSQPQTSESTSSISEALNTIQSCQADAFACVQEAGVPGFATCSQALRSCLLSIVPAGLDAGFTPPPLPSFTPPALPTGLPVPTLPTFDGGFRLPTLPTGLPVPTLPSFDAGFTPPPLPSFTPPTLPTGIPIPTLPSFDAGLPQPPAPPGGGTGVNAQTACLQQLQQCLGGSTSPMTCGTQAQTCLTAARSAQCDAQEQACVAAGLPQALCTAQRMACR